LIQGQSVVRYGANVRLMHVASGRFLSASSVAENDRQNRGRLYKVLLKENSNNYKSCVFFILPKHKIRLEGDFVYLHDDVVLKSIVTDQSLTMQNELIVTSKEWHGWNVRLFHRPQEGE